MNAEKKTVVRKATRKDVDGIIEVLKSAKLGAETWAGDEEWTRKTLKECLNLENYVFWVAERDHSVVGFVGCCVFPSFWEGEYQGMIGDFFVHPAFQGRGVGATLLKAVIEQTDAEGLGELHVSTEPENTGARRLYAKHGFTGERLLLERVGK